MEEGKYVEDNFYADSTLIIFVCAGAQRGLGAPTCVSDFHFLLSHFKTLQGYKP